ncbi:unnamed protein product [Amoebophrya sp. A120]|nr:unnamed protein product [Amoebophrya sp. A120]|eukprot:GSA120T00020352001.1
MDLLDDLYGRAGATGGAAAADHDDYNPYLDHNDNPYAGGGAAAALPRYDENPLPASNPYQQQGDALDANYGSTALPDYMTGDGHAGGHHPGQDTAPGHHLANDNVLEAIQSHRITSSASSPSAAAAAARPPPAANSIEETPIQPRAPAAITIPFTSNTNSGYGGSSSSTANLNPKPNADSTKSSSGPSSSTATSGKNVVKRPFLKRGARNPVSTEKDFLSKASTQREEKTPGKQRPPAANVTPVRSAPNDGTRDSSRRSNAVASDRDLFETASTSRDADAGGGGPSTTGSVGTRNRSSGSNANATLSAPRETAKTLASKKFFAERYGNNKKPQPGGLKLDSAELGGESSSASEGGNQYSSIRIVDREAHASELPDPAQSDLPSVEEQDGEFDAEEDLRGDFDEDDEPPVSSFVKKHFYSKNKPPGAHQKPSGKGAATSASSTSGVYSNAATLSGAALGVSASSVSPGADHGFEDHVVNYVVEKKQGGAAGSALAAAAAFENEVNASSAAADTQTREDLARKLKMLDAQIDRFKRENEQCKKLRMDREHALRQVEHERKKLREEVEQERAAMVAEIDEEREKMRKERNRIHQEREKHRQQVQSSKADVATNEQLTKQLKDLKEETSQKEARFRRTIERLQRQNDELLKKNSELQDDLSWMNRQAEKYAANAGGGGSSPPERTVTPASAGAPAAASAATVAQNSPALSSTAGHMPVSLDHQSHHGGTPQLVPSSANSTPMHHQPALTASAQHQQHRTLSANALTRPAPLLGSSGIFQPGMRTSGTSGLVQHQPSAGPASGAVGSLGLSVGLNSSSTAALLNPSAGVMQIGGPASTKVGATMTSSSAATSGSFHMLNTRANHAVATASSNFAPLPSNGTTPSASKTLSAGLKPTAAGANAGEMGISQDLATEILKSLPVIDDNVKDPHEIPTEKISPDGRVERMFRDGRREIQFTNGLKKVLWPDARCTVLFTNGDTKHCLADGTVIYRYSETAATQTTFSTGIEVFQFASGQIERHFPTGEKEIKFANGTTKKIYADLREEIRFPDGVVKHVAPKK